VRKVIFTNKAPLPIGPYSQAVQCGSMLYLSGQIPVDPASGELVESDINLQTEQVFKNIIAVLEAEKITLEHVVKTTVFLSDFANFAEMNKIYGDYFGETNAPARSTVEVAALPLGSLVEIEVIADLSHAT
jgi:2-iminobutanoate/2-iminopropanoate deaminase